MPADPTPRLGLPRPVGGDDADVPADLDALTDALDNLVPYDSGSRAARPAAATPGRIYYSTDQGSIDIDIGTAWRMLRPAQSGSLPSYTPDAYEGYLLVVDPTGTRGGPHIWDLVYRPETTGPYKWHAVGAAPLTVSAANSAGLHITEGYVTVASILVPVSGWYVVDATCHVLRWSGSGSAMIGGYITRDSVHVAQADAGVTIIGTTDNTIAISGKRLWCGAGNSITLRLGAAGGAAARAYAAHIAARPLQLG